MRPKNNSDGDQRCVVDEAVQVTTSSVTLPRRVKSRIIGKEGRNTRLKRLQELRS